MFCFIFADFLQDYVRLFMTSVRDNCFKHLENHTSHVIANSALKAKHAERKVGEV